MIINIISRQNKILLTRGPKKVFDNLLFGLKQLNIHLVFNQPINKFKYNWIHDDPAAVIEAGLVGKPILLGPNIVELPNDLPILRKKLPEGSTYLHPSSWPVKIWLLEGYNETKLKAWPVGIDTEKFLDVNRENNNKVLLYFKQRDNKLLEKAKEIIKSINIELSLIEYGKYSEQEYIKALKEAKFGIWIGCTESQGIGLQEALASNLPLIVLDATTLFENAIKPKKSRFKLETFKKLTAIKTSSAPYFDESCGIKIKNISELNNAIKELSANINKYQPREYILQNLTLIKSAQLFLDLFKDMQVKEETSLNYKYLSKVICFADFILRKNSWIKILNKFFITFSVR
jgi:hypothetical protein